MVRVIVCVALFFVCRVGAGYTSGIAISSDKSMVMLVYVNGKLYNKSASNFIRIKSTEGLFHLRVKLLNLKDRTWREVARSVRISKGFEYQFNVVVKESKRPELHQIKRYPVYSRYFLDYTLYTRSTTS
jgi:hypothetical protein